MNGTEWLQTVLDDWPSLITRVDQQPINNPSHLPARRHDGFRFRSTHPTQLSRLAMDLRYLDLRRYEFAAHAGSPGAARMDPIEALRHE